MNRLKRISSDFAIGILASVIYTCARQIVVFPLLAARLTDVDYGIMLTVAGLANVCTAMTGSTLNNIRLIRNGAYAEAEICGDFNRLNAYGCYIAVIYAAVLRQVFSLSGITFLLLAAYLVISNLYQYATCFFRLELNFKRSFLCNVLVSLAYCLAVPLFSSIQLWPAIFLIGEGAGLLFVTKTTPFFREPYLRTQLWSQTTTAYLTLAGTNLIANLLTYTDRMILYPILGGEGVSYYSTASFFGKSASIVMVPIAGVLLGYFAQKDFKASKKLFALVNGCSLACLAVFLLGCWLFAPWFTRLLYPSLYEGAAPYILLANLAAAISIAGNMAQPMVLKACSTRWVLLTQVFYVGSYLLLSGLYLADYGLLGFCWISIVSNMIRLISLYIIGFLKI